MYQSELLHSSAIIAIYYCGYWARSKPAGTANWYLKCCHCHLSSRIPPGVSRQAQRAIHQLRLNRLTSTASYQALIGQIESPTCPVVMGTRRLNIFCCSVQNRQQNASVTLVIRLTSQMCFRTMGVWCNSTSLRDICPPHIGSAGLTSSSWQQQQHWVYFACRTHTRDLPISHKRATAFFS